MLASAETVPAIDAEDDADIRENQKRWYAVHCQSHRERAAAFNLENQGYEVFLPWRTKSRRHARKIETVRVPFFPGYLFVSLDITRERWRNINGTFGVVRILTQGDDPMAVRRGVVEALREVSDDSGAVCWRPDLKIGQSVRILTGPFVDFVGRLDQLTNAGRVCVLLDLLGGQTPMSLPHTSIGPATSCL
jgi:transcription elongation factor/antiterminator RfaH